MHLLGVTMHAALHVAAPTCLGRAKNNNNILLSLSSLSQCVKNDRALKTKLSREHRKAWLTKHTGEIKDTPCQHRHPSSLFPSSLLLGWPSTSSVERLGRVEGMECSVAVRCKVSTGGEREESKWATMAPLWVASPNWPAQEDSHGRQVPRWTYK